MVECCSLALPLPPRLVFTRVFVTIWCYCWDSFFQGLLAVAAVDYCCSLFACIVVCVFVYADDALIFQCWCSLGCLSYAYIKLCTKHEMSDFFLIRQAFAIYLTWTMLCRLTKKWANREMLAKKCDRRQKQQQQTIQITDIVCKNGNKKNSSNQNRTQIKAEMTTVILGYSSKQKKNNALNKWPKHIFRRAH